MNPISFCYANAIDFFKTDQLEEYQGVVTDAHNYLHQKTATTENYLGWVDYPIRYDKQEFFNLKAMAKEIKEKADILIVIGVGGSYLGAKAALNFLKSPFLNYLSDQERKCPQIFFAGYNIDSNYLKNLLFLIQDKEVYINIISKSGSTLETALTFRFLRQHLEQKYGLFEAAKRIIATTDDNSGSLSKIACKKGYRLLKIPADIGGRYSVLTPVGMFPLAVSGISIDKILQGAADCYKMLANENISKNICYQYALIRNIFYQQNYVMELLVNYDVNLKYFGDWYQQLFAESEGKEGRGLFPTALNYTTDLHSVGQYVQEGPSNLFQTILNVERIENDLILSEENENLDNLNYLAGQSWHEINQKAMWGALKAHYQGQVPNLMINIPSKSAYYYGMLTFFFMKACGMSGLILGVNPFNQPGVEAYKKQMMSLLKRNE